MFFRDLITSHLQLTAMVPLTALAPHMALHLLLVPSYQEVHQVPEVLCFHEDRQASVVY